MSTVLDEMLIKLGYDPDVSGAQKFNASLENVLSTATKIGTALSLAGGVVGGILTKGVIDTSEYIDQSRQLADVANVTTQELQRMTAGAERYQISQEKLADILKDVGDKVGDFIQTGGGEMADFFENIAPKVGVTAEQFKNLSSKDALQLYVDSLEKANVSQSDMQFYMEAIASDATMLLPLLKDGGKGFEYWGDQAQKAGRVASEAEIANAKKFQDNLTKAKSMLGGFVNRLSVKFTPYFNVALEKFIDSKDELDSIADSIFRTFDGATDLVEKGLDSMDWIKDALFDVWDYALYARDAFDSLNEKFNLTEKLTVALAAGMGLLVANMAGLTAAKTISTVMSIAGSFTALLNPVSLVGIAIIGLGLVIQDFYGFLNGKDSIIGELVDKYPELWSVIGIVLQLVEAVKSIWTDNEESIGELWQALKDLGVALMPLIRLLGDIIPPLFSFMLDVAIVAIEGISMAVGGLAKAFTNIAKIITFIWEGLWSVLSSIFDGFFGFVIGRLEGLLTVIKGTIGGLKSVLDGDLIGGLAEIGEGVIKGAKQTLDIAGSGPTGNYSGASVVKNNSSRAYYDERSVTQHINVNSAEEASMIASRTAQATRQNNLGYI